MSAFFSKKIAFFVPKSTFTQSNSVKDFLVLFSVFIKQKVTITENITFAYSVSGILPPDCTKLAKNPKNDNDVAISWHNVIVKIFWRGFISLVKFRYWSKFHVNIVTGSGIMAILFYKGLTRNLEIGNTHVWILPNIWRLGRVMDTKFGTNVSNKIWLNAAKFQGYSFYNFELLRENQLGGWSGGKIIRIRNKIAQCHRLYAYMKKCNIFNTRTVYPLVITTFTSASILLSCVTNVFVGI